MYRGVSERYQPRLYCLSKPRLRKIQGVQPETSWPKLTTTKHLLNNRRRFNRRRFLYFYAFLLTVLPVCDALMPGGLVPERDVYAGSRLYGLNELNELNELNDPGFAVSNVTSTTS